MFFIGRKFSYVFYQEKIQLCFLFGENLVMFCIRRKLSYVFYQEKIQLCYLLYQKRIQLCFVLGENLVMFFYQEKIQLCFLIGENLVMFLLGENLVMLFTRRKFSYVVYLPQWSKMQLVMQFPESKTKSVLVLFKIKEIQFCLSIFYQEVL